MRNYKEDNLQVAAVTWFRYQYPEVTIFAIPNGGSRNPIEAAKLKRTGTLAGVADLFVMSAAWVGTENMMDQRLYHGLFIELKVGKNKQTDAQLKFETESTMAGYGYRVCRSLDEFMEVVNNYLSH